MLFIGIEYDFKNEKTCLSNSKFFKGSSYNFSVSLLSSSWNKFLSLSLVKEIYSAFFSVILPIIFSIISDVTIKSSEINLLNMIIFDKCSFWIPIKTS